MKPSASDATSSIDENRLRDLDATSWNTRGRAFEELFREGSRSVQTLIAGTRHRSPRVRAACVALMDHLGDDRCCESLMRSLDDPSARVRRHAVHAVGCQACKAHPLPMDVAGALITRAMEDPSIRVRRVAVHQLGLQPHEPRIVEALMLTLTQSRDGGLVSRARHALRVQQEKAVRLGASPVTARRGKTDHHASL